MNCCFSVLNVGQETLKTISHFTRIISQRSLTLLSEGMFIVLLRHSQIFHSAGPAAQFVSPIVKILVCWNR